MHTLAAAGFSILRGASLRSVPVAPASWSGAFARNGDYGDVAHDAAFNLTSALTIEWWAFPFADATAFPVLLCKGAVNTAYTVLINASDQMQITIKPSGAQVNVADTVAVTRNAWTHWAATLDGTTLRLYRAGTEVASAACGPCSTNTGVLRFGDADSPPTNSYRGLLDEVRLWNVVRTQAQISANRNVNIDPATPGLVGYWKFNGGKGRTAVDSTAGRNATLRNSDQWSPSVPF